jgi:CRISPR-associated exonuclease Cas4
MNRPLTKNAHFYQEDDLLLISGIQHFVYCPRQWMLIHIEQVWQENPQTVQGTIFHEHVHGSTKSSRSGIITSRGMPVVSRALGIQGVCDVVEFHPAECGVALSGRKGRYLPLPVEYKRGRPKRHDADQLQLCAQAVCLEEMFGCKVPHGFLFYGETRKKERVELGQDIRERLQGVLSDMHRCFEAELFDASPPKGSCRSCSLKNLCVPELLKIEPASSYINARMREA